LAALKPEAGMNEQVSKLSQEWLMWSKPDSGFFGRMIELTPDDTAFVSLISMVKRFHISLFSESESTMLI